MTERRTGISFIFIHTVYRFYNQRHNSAITPRRRRLPSHADRRDIGAVSPGERDTFPSAVISLDDDRISDRLVIAKKISKKKQIKGTSVS